jgi:hydroxylamine dehydrogenase
MRQYNWFIFSAVLIAGLMFGRCHAHQPWLSPTLPKSRNTASSAAFRPRPWPASNATSRPTRVCSATGPTVATPMPTSPAWTATWPNPAIQDVAKGTINIMAAATCPIGEEKYKVPIAAIVTPKDCSRCHPDEVTQYSKSKHANTIEIMWKLDPWLNKGMNSDNERKTGCLHCHGTVVAIDDKGKLDSHHLAQRGRGPAEPGRQQGLMHLLPHAASLCGIRGPKARSLRLLPSGAGSSPDRNLRGIQARHHLQCVRDEFNFKAAAGTWSPGTDYRAPTCAACHMSGSGKVMGTHDVTERISWETQAPLTVRPADFKPFPSGNDWQVEREKMKNVCRSCHGDSWINDFYQGFDKAVEEYNEVYLNRPRPSWTNFTARACWTRPSFSTNASR